MAKISIIQDAILLCRAARVTPFCWGHRGIGKSSLVQQLCARMGWGFIDMRCSQLEASDIRGLPDAGDDGRTHYLPPADMPIGDLELEEIKKELGNVPPQNDLVRLGKFETRLTEMQGRHKNGILFLDELNRASDDVLQAGFQLVLDRRCGQYVLPPGWSLVAAGNFMEGYMVSGFNDPAFLNRFSHMVLAADDTTLPEWVDYMSTMHGPEAADVIEYASQNLKHLDGEISGEMGFSIQPSRRSWDAVVRIIHARKQGKYHDDAYQTAIAGLVGHEAALAFTRYSCPVKPLLLLQHGVKRYEKELKKLNRNQVTGLMWGLISVAKNRIDEDDVATVCLDFAEYMLHQHEDKDVVVAFARALAVGSGSEGNEKTQAAVISNPMLAKMVAQFHQKSNHKKGFVERLVDRPELHKVLSKTAWGDDK